MNNMKVVGYLARGLYWSRLPKEFAIVQTESGYEVVKSETLKSTPVYLGKKLNLEYMVNQSIGIKNGTFRSVQIGVDCEDGAQYMMRVLNEHFDARPGKQIKIRFSDVDSKFVLVALYKDKIAISEHPWVLAQKIQRWL